MEGGGWYSVSEGGDREPARHVVFYDRPGLTAYLSTRHRDTAERLELLEVSSGYDGRRRIAHIEFRIRREASDLDELGITTSVASGKGAISCRTHRIGVWSMSMRAGGVRDSRICPRPSRRTRRPLACAPTWRQNAGRPRDDR